MTQQKAKKFRNLNYDTIMALSARVGFRDLSMLARRLKVPVNSLHDAINKYRQSRLLKRLPPILGCDHCQMYLPPKEVLEILPPPAGADKLKPVVSD